MEGFLSIAGTPRVNSKSKTRVVVSSDDGTRDNKFVRKLLMVLKDDNKPRELTEVLSKGDDPPRQDLVDNAFAGHVASEQSAASTVLKRVVDNSFAEQVALELCHSYRVGTSGQRR
jgi:hypothetical protein